MNDMMQQIQHLLAARVARSAWRSCGFVIGIVGRET